MAVVVAVLVVLAGLTPFTGVGAPATPTESGDGVQPGERLAGVVGVQGTELKTDMAMRSFHHQFETAASNQSKASLVAAESAALEARLVELQDRRASLEAALANDSISRGQYIARVAHLMAAEQSLTRMLNVTVDAAVELPSAALTEAGVSVTELQSMVDTASNITGSTVSAVAKEIAGPPQDVGAGGQATGAIQQAQATIRVADRQIDAAIDRVGEDNDQIETAQDRLEEAREQLADAREAASDGDTAEAIRLADQARNLADEARTLAQDAAPGDDEDEDEDDRRTVVPW